MLATDLEAHSDADPELASVLDDGCSCRFAILLSSATRTLSDRN